MALRNIPPPEHLRAHRPKPADTMTQIPADAYYPDTEDLLRPSWLRQHLNIIGAGMFFMMLLWFVGTQYVLPVVLDKVDHWNTGEARISHYDLNVGHGGKSHFLTQYWHNQVVLIEFPGGDVSHGKVYTAPVMAINGKPVQRVVSLTIGNFNPHGKADKPDIAASITGFAAPVIFYNTGDGFSTEEP